MELQIIDAQGASTTTMSASDEIFGREYNEALIHQVVVAYQANGRAGNRAQKTRAEVRHSTKKPWKQKGTGNARAGMTSSPIWRGGGRAFASRVDENFTHKVNRKMYRAGLAAILSQLVREDRLHVVESFAIDAPKTKLVAGACRSRRPEAIPRHQRADFYRQLCRDDPVLSPADRQYVRQCAR